MFHLIILAVYVVGVGIPCWVAHKHSSRHEHDDGDSP